MNRTRIALDPAQFPEELRPCLQDAAVFDSSCSEDARVFYIDRNGGLFLKRYAAGKLKTEAEKLCDTAAVQLRRLHEIRADDCPVKDRLDSYRALVLSGHEHGKYEPDLFRGLWEFASREEAWQTAQRGLPCLKKEVLIHGDYCLPNIILDNWRFSGFIDVGAGGISDRHIDILWGIWTLKYNLGTVRWTERFMDAYGRDRIDRELLRCIAAMEMIGNS